MRTSFNGAWVLQFALTALMLTAAVLISGCASKRASDQAKNQQVDSSRLALHAPTPGPAQGSQRQGLGAVTAGPAAGNDDGARYAAIYGVAPPPAYYDEAERQELARLSQVPVSARYAADFQPQRAQARAQGARRIVVTRGDTLYNIAGRYRTSVTALLVANRLSESSIEIGQELIIPAGASRLQ